MSRLSTLLALVVAAAVSFTGLAYRRPAAFRVDIGGDDTAYVQHFNEREGQGDAWRWSSARSQIVFHNAGQIVPRARVRMRLAAYRPAGAPLPEVSLAINGEPLGQFAASRRFEIRDAEVDDARAGPGDWTLTLASSNTLIGRDGRTLGVQVVWAELVPTGLPLIPPRRTLVSVVVIALAIFAIARGRRGGMACLLLSLGASLLSALGLAFAREAAVSLLLPLAVGLVLVAAVLLARRTRFHERPLAALAASNLSGVTALTGFALAIGGQVLVSVGPGRVWGLAALTLGVAAIALVQGATPSSGRGADDGCGTRREALAVLSITALALLLRLYRLSDVPFAIFRDEARHGLVALRILGDPAYRPLFLGPPINQPIPYFIALAYSFKALGSGLFSLRLVSAVAGAVLVPLLWFLVRGLYGARIALLAAFGLAVSSWHVSISRFAVNYVEPSLLTLPAYAFLWRGLRTRRPLDWALGGLLVGLSQYASHTAKGVFFVTCALVADDVVTRWRARDASGLRLVFVGVSCAAVMGVATLLPLAKFVAEHPGEYLARPAQVAIWNEENRQGEYLAVSFGRNLARYAGAFNVAGDSNGRHHLPGAPFLDPVLGVCFLIGGIVVLGTLRSSAHRFLLAWLVGSLVPGLVTVSAPSALRAVEAAAPTYVLSALGAAAVWDRVGSLRPRPQQPSLSLVAVGALATVLAYNAWIYFVRMYESPAVWRRFAPISTRLAETVTRLHLEGALDAGASVHVPQVFMDDPDNQHVFEFLTEGRFDLRPYEDIGASVGSAAGHFAIAVPNYTDFWHLVAAAEPRYTSDANEAAIGDARRRVELAPWLSGRPSVIGESFPGTDRPTFWLYLVAAPPPSLAMPSPRASGAGSRAP